GRRTSDRALLRDPPRSRRHGRDRSVRCSHGGRARQRWSGHLDPGELMAPVPQWAPAPAEYDDLALALDGIFPDVSVTVPADRAPEPGEVLDLTDPEGTPVARLRIASCVRQDQRHALSVPVTALAPREDGVFRH